MNTIGCEIVKREYDSRYDTPVDMSHAQAIISALQDGAKITVDDKKKVYANEYYYIANIE